MPPKFEELSWQHVAALLGVGVLALTAWVVWIFGGPTDTAPAWVQAVGSVFAIIAGFAIVGIQFWNERRKAAEADAVSVRRFIRSIQTEASTNWDVLNRNFGRFVLGTKAGDPIDVIFKAVSWPFPVYDNNSLELGKIESDADRTAIISAYTYARGMLSTLELNTELVANLAEARAEHSIKCDDISKAKMDLAVLQLQIYGDSVRAALSELEREVGRVMSIRT